MRVCIEKGKTIEEFEENLNKEIESLEDEGFKIKDIRFFDFIEAATNDKFLCGGIFWGDQDEC